MREQQTEGKAPWQKMSALRYYVTTLLRYCATANNAVVERFF